MKNGSETHGKGGEKTGPAKAVPSKEQKVVPPKKGNKPDPFVGGKGK